MNKNKKKDEVRLSRTKRLFFHLILICMLFLIFAFLELFLRIIQYGDNLNLVVPFPGKEYREYKIINPEIGKKYFQKLQYTRPCHDMFLKDKPENGFRIFLLGSSTVFGYPYEENLLFSRILQQRLQDCYPEKHVEMINTSITAINSFTLLDFTDEILNEEPDALLIYTGHNEFYGAHGIGSVERTNSPRILILWHLDLLSLRSYQLLRNTINGIRELVLGRKTSKGVRGTLMKLIVDKKEIAYKSEIYNITMDRYKKNMDQLLKKATRKKVPVFISEVIANVKDFRPFCSIRTAEYPAATEVYENGLKSEQKGYFEKAKENYYFAKDLDCIRFRASEEINEIIRELAAKYHAHLVPMKSRFEEASPNELIGSNLLTEHVHPNIEGYFIMADAFFNELTKSKLIDENIDMVHYKNSAYYQKNWGYTELDSLIGVHKINILKNHWPFQPFDATSVDYLETYQPTSLVDSLALAVVKPPATKQNEAHLTMAYFYKKRGNFYKAFKEFHAAIRYFPYQVKDYLEAATCLMYINDFPLALDFFNKSLELQKTFFAYYNISEILFIKRNYAESIEALNKASKLDNSLDAREKIMKKLYKIYFYSGNDVKAQEVLDELRRVNPHYQPYYPKDRTDYVYLVPLQVKNQISRALNFYSAGNFEAALNEFLKSLEVKETSIANRYVGDLLAARNDNSCIIYYLRAYPDYKKDVDFLFNLSRHYVQNDQIDEAQRILEELRQLDPDNEKVARIEKDIRKNN